MSDLMPDDAVEGVIMPADVPVTRVILEDAAGVPIYRATFPAGSCWVLDLWAIGIEYGMPMRINVQEAP